VSLERLSILLLRGSAFLIEIALPRRRQAERVATRTLPAPLCAADASSRPRCKYAVVRAPGDLAAAAA
jgi:hypothetical protein